MVLVEDACVVIYIARIYVYFCRFSLHCNGRCSFSIYFYSLLLVVFFLRACVVEYVSQRKCECECVNVCVSVSVTVARVYIEFVFIAFSLDRVLFMGRKKGTRYTN